MIYYFSFDTILNIRRVVLFKQKQEGDSMSTQTVPQVQSATTETAPVTATTTTATATSTKKPKITDSIVATLRGLEEGQTMTITELAVKLPETKRETLQATLSQMVKAKRVEKVVTGKRQPGYKATK